jgi:AAA+ ATPase superfamily predicted ATPase
MKAASTTQQGVKPGNPFHPQFGKRPDKFVGRDHIIRGYIDSLTDKNDPHRTTVVTGIRGSGKTALLSGIKEAIDHNRFVAIDVTAGSELNQSILDQLQIATQSPQRTLTGVNVGALGFTVGLETSLKESTHGFRYYLTLFVEELKRRGQGVVFLIDEIHYDRGAQEIREFATTYQHLVRDGHDVALLMAGLPRSISRVLNDKVLTFLHRAHKLMLANINIMQVEHLYQTTFAKVSSEDSAEALGLAADATFGFPYLIQLMGYYLWKDSARAIKAVDVEKSLVNSKVELFQNVYELMLQEISERDREFLLAMLEDRSDTRFAELAKRMGVSIGYASKYRQRLLESGFLTPTVRGSVRLAPPYMKEFLSRYAEEFLIGSQPSI